MPRSTLVHILLMCFILFSILFGINAQDDEDEVCLWGGVVCFPITPIPPPPGCTACVPNLNTLIDLNNLPDITRETFSLWLEDGNETYEFLLMSLADDDVFTTIWSAELEQDESIDFPSDMLESGSQFYWGVRSPGVDSDDYSTLQVYGGLTIVDELSPLFYQYDGMSIQRGNAEDYANLATIKTAQWEFDLAFALLENSVSLAQFDTESNPIQLYDSIMQAQSFMMTNDNMYYADIFEDVREFVPEDFRSPEIEEFVFPELAIEGN